MWFHIVTEQMLGFKDIIDVSLLKIDMLTIKSSLNVICVKVIRS